MTSNSTLPPTKQRPSQARTRQKELARVTTARRQTAHLEGRRDGKPLIFGWGSHLTRSQKTRVQTLAAYSFMGAIVVALLGLAGFGILQQNVLIPNQDIVKINATGVSQDTYRKTLAYNAQDLWNTVQADIKIHDALVDKLTADKNNTDLQKQFQILIEKLQSETGNYSQAALTQTTMDQLVEDRLLQDNVGSKIQPASDAITKKLNDFKAAFPKGESYGAFLSKNNLSENDVRTAIALHIRRDLAQPYLASQLTSPSRQAHVRHIEVGDKATAAKILADLKAKKLTAPDANWNDIAKTSSVDPNSKNTGGDIGWVTAGVQDAGIEIWALDPSRKAGDLTQAPVATAGGSWDIIQVLEINPSRAVDATQLKSSQDNALSHTLSGLRVAPFTKISTPDADAMTAARNLPQTPNVNATLPNFTPKPSQGTNP